MTTVAYNRRVGKTGQPLGLIDVLSKIVETGVAAVGQWSAARRARRLAGSRTRAASEAIRAANSVRRLADSHRVQSPGDAADLYAAADQHELRQGV